MRQIIALSFLVAVAGGASSRDSCHSPCDVGPSLYQRQATLQETLLTTRQRYHAWRLQQPALRKEVIMSPWSATPPLPSAEAEKHVPPGQQIDSAAKLPDGQALWSQRTDVVDGKPVKLSAGSDDTALFLARTLRAARAGTLTVGIGGGTRLDLWLNGCKVASACTRLSSGRYGCSYRVDGTRVDQLLVDLDLQAGENSLLVRLTRSDDPLFYFSTVPRPVSRLWAQIRRDFPQSQNPLLELVHADWFEEQGWLDVQDTSFEERCIDALAADCGTAAPSIREELHRLRRAGAGPDDRRWLDLCVKSAVLARLQSYLARLLAAVNELGRSQPDNYPAAELLDQIEDYQRRLIDQAGRRLDPVDARVRGLMAELPQMQRRMLVDLNPLLAGAEIVCVKRFTYDSKHYYDDFQHISRWGGQLCVISLKKGISPICQNGPEAGTDAQRWSSHKLDLSPFVDLSPLCPPLCRVREIVPQLEGGVFDRYDLSFDARRVLFGYRRPLPEGFRIYEVGLDGSGLRQVTHTPADEEQRIATYGQTSTGDSFYGSMGYRFWTDDVHPCYLPDGGICFASTRCEHGVLCTPKHYLACTNLFRIDADGSRMRPLSLGALSEFTPTMMEDGRILYNRWEYVYKGIAAVQPLWVMRPDGSGSEEFYGDNVTNPGVLWQARQVPGHPRLAVCIGCGHEPMGIGQVLLLNLNKDKRTTEPMSNLTPQVKTQNLRGLYQQRNGVWREDIYGPFYADPYPLSDKFFLVACNPDKRYNDPAAYGLYLLDAFGNRVPIYHDPAMSCWQPMLLRPRPTPPVLPSVVARAPLSPRERAGMRAEAQETAEGNAGRHPNSLPKGAGAESQPLAQGEETDAPATLFLSDVYRGLPGVERGTVKYIRVMEQIPKPWSAELDANRGEDRGADGFGGHLAISWNTHIWVAVLHGVVPVEEDGSACFEVPARANLFFQALDADFMEVQRMRTFVHLEPGERRSCIGCHEHRTQAPETRPARALAKAPTKPVAQPGELAPRPLDYATDVQPTLDRHCVRCHNGKDPKTKLDLRGELTALFNRSYESLLQAGMVNAIREWNGGQYAMQNAEAVPPYSLGSHRSKLVEVLKAGHYDAKLSPPEWIKLATWIDCGAPYYGSYFGRRNLKYAGQPDFRPVPTLSAARGIAPLWPKPLLPEPLPAQLLAHWPLDAAPFAAAASCDGLHARPVNLTLTAGHRGSGAGRFDGESFIRAAGLGAQEAVSVALWVKAESLANRWNPLLFTDGRGKSAFHFSVRDDGAPNVAINSDGKSWVHNGATGSIAAGQWCHVAVVCDTRPGGTIRFYIDGKPAGTKPLGLVAIDLDSFRIGAWSGWEKQPRNNFHGCLDDVRIYRGMLTSAEVAALAEVPEPAAR